MDQGELRRFANDEENAEGCWREYRLPKTFQEIFKLSAQEDIPGQDIKRQITLLYWHMGSEAPGSHRGIKSSFHKVPHGDHAI